ncbi:MAG: cellulase family glycosylhydrolase [Verrucomicrobia subdivision 3 bacterium]|nr:cellulase family glycosylhydrolase [Limisphaerales bacterium]
MNPNPKQPAKNPERRVMRDSVVECACPLALCPGGRPGYTNGYVNPTSERPTIDANAMPHHLRRVHMRLFLCLVVLTSAAMGASGPLALHPDNPHYFVYRGKPAVLITSVEHYGAVLNLDFNYTKYLDILRRDGLNLTRTFSGAYVEPVGAFNIASNTLAPMPGAFICPWARSDTPGGANGGNKFDLNRWDEAYFKRLKDFVDKAEDRGIIVEMNLFCPFYEESQWKLSPQNADNNVNGVGKVARTNVYTLNKHGGLLPVHEAMVRKIVMELRNFDNVYYEICNEPYFGGVTLEWQHRMADVITETQRPFRFRHLISQNIANNKALVQRPHPQISIFNFHYAYPPNTVTMNYRLNKAIGDNETGFAGTNNFPYRREAWKFILAGGGLFNHLDYSFAVGHEDGTFVYPAKQPGGGNPAFRREMRVLKDFIHSFNFIAMRPATNVVVSKSDGLSARALAQVGSAYAIYLCETGKPTNALVRDANIALGLPSGNYRLEWINTRTGKPDKRDRVEHAGGQLALRSPPFIEDVALRILLR